MSDDGFRDFRGRVTLIALLRVVHVVGVVGTGAAVLHDEAGAADGFLSILVVSGLAIAALDRWAKRDYFIRVGGLAVLLKAVLLISLVALGAFGQPAFWSLLVFSVAIAHAPGRLRHRRIVSR